MRFGEGPCWQAFATGEAVVVADLTAEPRWPEFTATALDLGFRGVAGFPLHVDGDRIGALDVYNDAPLRLTSEDRDAACVLADVAAAYVVNARAIGESRRLNEQLQQALDSRVVIEQAKGVLAERLRVGPYDAFVMLRNYARRNGARLRTVAQGVLEGSTDVGP